MEVEREGGREVGGGSLGQRGDSSWHSERVTFQNAKSPVSEEPDLTGPGFRRSAYLFGNNT